jgi:hypothetical protein
MTSHEIVYPQSWSAQESEHVIRSRASDIISVVRTQELKGGKPLSTQDFFASALKTIGRDVPDDAREVVRTALSSASVTVAFSNQVNLLFQDAYSKTPNTLEEITTIQNVENFLPATAISQWQSGRLTLGGKNQADSFYFGLAGQSWGIARFTTTFTIDEQDISNAPQVPLFSIATKAVATAAKRCVSDLLWALILSNPVMSDGNALFSTAHGNYLASGSQLTQNEPEAMQVLDAGLNAVGSQILSDDRGFPINIGLTPTKLICSPACFGAGRRLARRMKLDDANDISVSMESRLSSGVVNPKDDAVYSAAAGSWLLAVPASVTPSIILGGLDGQVEPTLRMFPLGGPGSPGQWGMQCDCKLDIGAVLTDFRPLYFGSGN